MVSSMLVHELRVVVQWLHQEVVDLLLTRVYSHSRKMYHAKLKQNEINSTDKQMNHVVLYEDLLLAMMDHTSTLQQIDHSYNEEHLNKIHIYSIQNSQQLLRVFVLSDIYMYILYTILKNETRGSQIHYII